VQCGVNENESKFLGGKQKKKKKKEKKKKGRH
jgi:hypothetical protein